MFAPIAYVHPRSTTQPGTSSPCHERETPRIAQPHTYAARSPSGKLPSPWLLPRLPRRLLLLVSYLASRVVSRFTLRLSRRLWRPSRLSLHASSPASSLASLASSLASLASSLTSLASSPVVSRRCSFSRRSRWCSSSRRVSVSGLGGVQRALMVAVSLGNYFLHVLKNIKPKSKSFLKQNFQSCAPCAPNLPCA